MREGWEGLVRGNEVAEPEGEFPHGGAPEAATPLPERRSGGFVSTYGEGELLKEGEGEQTLKGRYIIRVSMAPSQLSAILTACGVRSAEHGMSAD